MCTSSVSAILFGVFRAGKAMGNIGAVCRQQGNFQAHTAPGWVKQGISMKSACKLLLCWNILSFYPVVKLLLSAETCATLLPNWSCRFECCWCWSEIQFAPVKVGVVVSTVPRWFSRQNVPATSKRTIPCSPSNIEMVLLTPLSKTNIIIIVIIIINEPSLYDYCNDSCYYHSYYHFHQPFRSRKRRISLLGGGRLVSSGVTLESQLRVWSPRLAMGKCPRGFCEMGGCVLSNRGC